MKFFLGQLKSMLGGWGAAVTYLLLLFLVLLNFFRNVVTYAGWDMIQMYHPMKILTLTGDNPSGSFLLQVLPFLAVLPTGCAYFADRHTGERIFLISREGKTRYYFGKIAAAFVSTFIVFAVPLLMEILLNVIAFPLAATGDPSNSTRYAEVYINATGRYIFSGLYMRSAYLYAVVFMLMVAAVAGIFSAFAYSMSYFRIFRFRILLFLPVYVLLSVIDFIGRLLGAQFRTSYTYYLEIFNTLNKNVIGFFTVLLAMFAVAVLLTLRESRRDVL